MKKEDEFQKRVTHNAALAHIDGLIQPHMEKDGNATLCDKMVLKKTSVTNKEEEVFRHENTKPTNRFFCKKIKM